MAKGVVRRRELVLPVPVRLVVSPHSATPACARELLLSCPLALDDRPPLLINRLPDALSQPLVSFMPRGSPSRHTLRPA